MINGWRDIFDQVYLESYKVCSVWVNGLRIVLREKIKIVRSAIYSKLCSNYLLNSKNQKKILTLAGRQEFR